MTSRHGQLTILSQRLSAGLAVRTENAVLGLILVSILVLLIGSRGAGTG